MTVTLFLGLLRDEFFGSGSTTRKKTKRTTNLRQQQTCRQSNGASNNEWAIHHSHRSQCYPNYGLIEKRHSDEQDKAGNLRRSNLTFER